MLQAIYANPDDDDFEDENDDDCPRCGEDIDDCECDDDDDDEDAVDGWYANASAR